MFNSFHTNIYASTFINAGDQTVHGSNRATSQLTSTTDAPAPYVSPTRPVGSAPTSSPQPRPERIRKERTSITDEMKQMWTAVQLENLERTRPLNIGQLINLIRSDPAHPLHAMGSASMRTYSLRRNPAYAHLNTELAYLKRSANLNAAQVKLLDELFAESQGIHSGEEYIRTIHTDPRYALLRSVKDPSINTRLKMFRDHHRAAQIAPATTQATRPQQVQYPQLDRLPRLLPKPQPQPQQQAQAQAQTQTQVQWQPQWQPQPEPLFQPEWQWPHQPQWQYEPQPHWQPQWQADTEEATDVLASNSSAATLSTHDDGLDAFLTEPHAELQAARPAPGFQQDSTWEWMADVDLHQFDDAFDPALISELDSTFV